MSSKFVDESKNLISITDIGYDGAVVNGPSPVSGEEKEKEVKMSGGPTAGRY